MSEHCPDCRTRADRVPTRADRILEATKSYPASWRRTLDGVPNLWHLRRHAKMPDITSRERYYASWVSITHPLLVSLPSTVHTNSPGEPVGTSTVTHDHSRGEAGG